MKGWAGMGAGTVSYRALARLSCHEQHCTVHAVHVQDGARALVLRYLAVLWDRTLYLRVCSIRVPQTNLP